MSEQGEVVAQTKVLDYIIEFGDIEIDGPIIRWLIRKMRRFSGTELIVEQHREAALLQKPVWETVQMWRPRPSVKDDKRCGLVRLEIAEEFVVCLVSRTSVREVKETFSGLGRGHGRSKDQDDADDGSRGYVLPDKIRI